LTLLCEGSGTRNSSSSKIGTIKDKHSNMGGNICLAQRLSLVSELETF
ncbi:hypothetical protein SOVF_189710, partial [Spinacia oleracea]